MMTNSSLTFFNKTAYFFDILFIFIRSPFVPIIIIHIKRLLLVKKELSMNLNKFIVFIILNQLRHSIQNNIRYNGLPSIEYNFMRQV